LGFWKVKSVLRLGLWAKVVSRGRGLGETLGGFCGGGVPAGEKVWWRGLAVAMTLGVLGLSKACGRCGEFWAKAFVGLVGLAGKRSCGERKIWLNLG